MERSTQILFKLVLVLLVIILLLSSTLIIIYFVQSKQSQSRYDELASIVEQNRPSRPIPTKPIETDPSQPTQASGDTQPHATVPTTEPENPYVTIYHPETGEKMEILKEYAQVFMLNPDVVGWVAIDDTAVNYPVMQTDETNADYYLYLDFYEQWNPRGSIYVREECDVFAPSDNLTIYGHRMQDNTMFGNLARYEDKAFWEEHPYIQFDTIYTRQTYEIAYVLVTSATVGVGFPYHRFVDASSEEEYQEFLRLCDIYSIYDTGVEVSCDDKLISLSTCEYTQENGRLVIVAKRVWQDPATVQP